MKVRTNQQGFGHVALIFVVLFLGVVSFAGYKVISKNSSAGDAINSTAASVAVPKKISSKAELTQAGKALDSSSSDVDSNLNDNALNSDLNDML